MTCLNDIFQVCLPLRHPSKTRDLCEETEKTYRGLNSTIPLSDHVSNFQPVTGFVQIVVMMLLEDGCV